MANDPSEMAAGGSTERAASLRGSLAERPIPRLLYDLFRKQITGYLQIVDDSGDESRLYLRDGAPVHVERPNDIDRLDQVLIETGLISAETIRKLSESLEPGRRLGEVLIERNMVSARALGDALKVQMRRKLTRLFFPRKGEFAIYVESHPYGTGGEFGEMRVDPRCLLFQGIRAAYDDARLEDELAPLKTLAFRLLPTLAASVLEAMGFVSTDPTLKALSERMLGLADLPVPGAKRMDSLSVVLALLYTDLLETAPLATARTAELPTQKPVTGPTATMHANRTLELPTQKVPTGPSPTIQANRTASFRAVESPAPATPGTVPFPREAPRLPDPPRGIRTTGTFPAVNFGSAPAQTPRAPAPPGPAAEFNKTPSGSTPHATLSGRINELHDKLGTLSHFALLGISETAPLAEVGAAYLKNVRMFHPDRLPALGLGHLTEKAARIVAQLNDAQATLADPKRRTEYLAARSRPAQGAIIDSGQSIMAAERSFQMGEVMLRKGDFTKAVDAFAEAMRANPLEPIYKAYWAWARWDNPGPHKDRLVRETLKTIEETMKDRPKFPQGLYWIGMLHKHLGDLTAAANAFRAATGQDKNLLDAERELRVIELRRTRATASHPIPEKPSPATAARQKDGVFNKFLKR
jgi:hypothetical protein